MQNRLNEANSGSGQNTGPFFAILTDIKEALVGSEKDFTSLPMRKALFLLALPMVLEMAMESVFAIADIFFVASIGTQAVAIVGITESLMTVVYAIAGGLAIGTTALVSRRVGEKHFDDAGKVAVHALICALAVSLVIGIPGYFFAEDILRFMGASSSAINGGLAYTSIMLGANIVISLLFVLNAVFRGAGNAAIAMRVLLVANLFNIVLDPCLIYGLGPFPQLGVKGAAIATVTGRGLAVILQLVYLFTNRSRVLIRLRQLRYQSEILWKIIKLSVGGIAQNIIATSSWIFMVSMITGFGDGTIAGYTIAIRIIVFALLPSWGLSNAASTLVGQNLGAGLPRRSEQSALKAAVVNFIFMGILSIFLVAFPRYFIGFFTYDPEVLSRGAEALRIISYGFCMYGLGMVMSQAINGAGDTFTPTLLNLFCFWLLEIPLAWFLSHSVLQQNGIYYAIVLAESTLAFAGFMVFRLGRWKKMKV